MNERTDQRTNGMTNGWVATSNLLIFSSNNPIRYTLFIYPLHFKQLKKYYFINMRLFIIRFY